MDDTPPIGGQSTPLSCPVDGCTKTFTRADHVRRHISSSHQRALPFPCTVCHKRFGRRDLLKRHALKHEERTSGSSAKGKEHKPRVRQACTTCAAKKLKCDGEQPCKRCNQKDIQCSYPKTTIMPDDLVPHQSEETFGDTGNQLSSSHLPDSIAPTASPHTSYRVHTSSSNTTSVSSPLAGSSSNLMRPPEHTHPSGTPDSGFQNPMNVADGAYFADILDFGHAYNLDFNESDLSIFDNLDTEAPYVNQTHDTSVKTSQSKQPSNMFLVGGFEAFSKSLWYWNPPQHSQSRDERNDLMEHISTSGAGTSIKLGNECIDQATRDRYLMLVAESFRLNTAPVISNTSFFPSEKILNDLLQFSLAEQYVAIDSWVQNYFYQSKEMRIPLLAALVAHGAVQSALPTVQKFGYAFQEAIRMKGPSVFEEDESLTRELSVWQTMMLLLQIGLWSGIARKIELAESFLLPTLTMIRRSGCFQVDNYPLIQISPSLEGNSLQKRWHEFLYQESRKRLSVHALIHDAQCSMSLQINTCISVAEMMIPLPAPCDIWQAESAEVWKEHMLRSSFNGHTGGPTLAQCIDDITHLVGAQHHTDLPLSALAVLQGYWHLISVHQQAAALHWTCASVVPSSSLAYLNARKEELSALLTRFGQCIIPLVMEPPRRHIVLIHEVITMYNHIRMSDLQLFAGKQGERASKEAFNRLKGWMNSPDSRSSIRHAALVLKAARQLRFGSLRDFLAIAVYHASLTLWSYGTIARARRKSSRWVYQGPMIILDNHDTDAVESFIRTGHGAPCISIYNSQEGTSIPADLENPPEVMKACLGVLEGNFGKLAPGLNMPLLVENLSKLMRDLGEHAFISAK